jgi:hypothetical protein
MNASPRPEKPIVLYLAGQSHIGSTYLGRVLNQHPAIFCGGEMVYLHRRLAPDWGCSCEPPDRASVECEFWPRVIRKMDEQGAAPEDTTRLTWRRPREWKAGLFLPRNSARKRQFMDNNRAFFRTVSRLSGKPIVLDCSKNPWRLLPLWQDPELDIRVLHLMRNPRGQIASRMRYGHGFWHSAIMKYWRKNQVYRSLFGDSENYLCLSFDRFLEAPQETLAQIFDWLGIEHMDPFAVPQADYHHLCGGWAREDDRLAPPRPAVSRRSRTFTPLQERFVRFLDTRFFVGAPD